VNRIAQWDGVTWSGVGSRNGMGEDVDALADVYALAAAPNGTLFAGGYFTEAGGVTANRIAHWNGSAWRRLGSGMIWSGGCCALVMALAVAADGTLYAGGYFPEAGGIQASNIAQWEPVARSRRREAARRTILPNGMAAPGARSVVAWRAVLPSIVSRRWR
jgi:hypothetical protein